MKGNQEKDGQKIEVGTGQWPTPLNVYDDNDDVDKIFSTNLEIFYTFHSV